MDLYEYFEEGAAKPGRRRRLLADVVTETDATRA